MSEEKERVVVEAFLDGMKCRQIVKVHGVATDEVAAVLRKHGLTPKTGRPTTKTVDHHAFDTLTPESLYWLGFLFADGCIARGYSTPQIILDIQTRDRAHLEKFRTFLKSDYTISDVRHKASTHGSISVKDRTSVAFRVCSARLVEMINNYGLVAGKARRVPCASLAQSRDFWRGCVDGDGCVRLDVYMGGKYKFAQVQFCGRRNIVRCFRAFLRDNAILTNITRTTSGIFQIQTTGPRAVEITRLLYTNTTVALARKQVTAQEIMRAFVHFPSTR